MEGAADIGEILTYWFGDVGEGYAAGEQKTRIWFKRSDAIDAEIRQRFGLLVDKAAAGELDHWVQDARGRLALVILLDQFSRNLFRDSKEAFANDDKALSLCLEAVDCGHDRELLPIERVFLYMPTQHAEDVDVQNRGVELFRVLADDVPEAHRGPCSGFFDYAVKHRDVVAKFGRFPHRNAVLGRQNTPEESAHLEKSKFL
jgi:uncharacterized protein (DUF924 family)